MINDQNNFAILVISSDKYCDIWPTFFYCFQYNWPNCNLPIYLGSNTVEYKDDSNQVTTILSGDDLNWSSSLHKILNKIKEDYLLVILEDFLIISKVNEEEILKHFNYMMKNKINHMHDMHIGMNFDEEINENYGEYQIGAPYRTNVYGFWNKLCLQELLQGGESPWEFEIMGSYRSKAYDKFLALKHPPFQILNLVEKGRYTNKSFEYCEKNNIRINLNRKIWLKQNKLIKIFQIIYFNLIKKIPWNKRLRLTNIIRKLLICY